MPPGARHGDVHAPAVVAEAYSAPLVAANHADDNNSLLRTYNLHLGHTPS